MSYLFIWIIVDSMFLVLLQEVNYLYGYEMIIISYKIHWSSYYLLRSVLCFFQIGIFVVRMSVAGFTRSDFFVWFKNKLLSYFQFIDWSFTCIDLYVVSLYLNSCKWYVCGCFTRSDYVLCMILKWLLSYMHFID